MMAALKQGRVYMTTALGPCRCTLVNESRARLVPIAKRKEKFTDRLGREVEFEAPKAGIDVSPNSEIPDVTEQYPA